MFAGHFRYTTALSERQPPRRLRHACIDTAVCFLQPRLRPALEKYAFDSADRMSQREGHYTASVYGTQPLHEEDTVRLRG